MGQQVNISAARFLQKDLKSRETKGYTSVVVSLPTDDVEKITPSVLVHGRHRSSTVMWYSNPTTQSRKCDLYQHPKEGCKESKHTSPICAGEHRLNEHQCASPTCPKKEAKRLLLTVVVLPPPSV